MGRPIVPQTGSSLHCPKTPRPPRRRSRRPPPTGRCLKAALPFAVQSSAPPALRCVPRLVLCPWFAKLLWLPSVASLLNKVDKESQGRRDGRPAAKSAGAIANRSAAGSAVDHFTAVRVQNLPGHVGRIVRGQKDVAGRDLFGLAGALHRRVRAEGLDF